MTSKTALMRERYEQFGRGDLENALDLWADDFVWAGDSAGLPWSGRTEGREAATAVLVRTVQAFDTFALIPDEYLGEGDTVVVIGHIDATKADRAGRMLFAHVWRFRGDQVVALQVISDSVEGARILGSS
jgi:ketosteroid isomerase-like protein